MKRFGKILLSSLGAMLGVAVVVIFAYFAYVQVTVQAAQEEAQRASLVSHLPAQSRSDPAALRALAPRPWSSPLHSRRFDDAISGAVAAYDKGNYDRAITLNSEALKIRPSADLVWLLLTRRGSCYLAKGDADHALADFDEAEHLGGLDPETQTSRAFALRLKGKTGRAWKDIARAIAAKPDDPATYIERASLSIEDGRLDDAISDYETALELSPRNIEARLRLAEICLLQKKPQRAIMHTTVALKIDKNLVCAHVIQAKAYAQLWIIWRARAELETALNLRPRDRAEALNDLAWCQATAPQHLLRDGSKALAEASEACELSHWKNPSYIDTLAAACAEAGDFDGAVKYAQQVLAMGAGPANKSRMEKRLALYQRHKPYREAMDYETTGH